MNAAVILIIVLGLLVIFALLGWSWFVVRMSMASLEQAKAYEAVERIEHKIDQRVGESVAIAIKRIREAQGPRSEEEGLGAAGSRILDDEGEALREARRRGDMRLFSGAPPQDVDTEGMPPLSDMPVPGVDVEG